MTATNTRLRRRAPRGEKTEFREFEGTPYFDGCLPIEVMAERGRETLRHGPMKPVGLTNAHAPERQALCRRAAQPGQRARHAVQHGRLPDQAQIWRTDPHLPHDPRPRARRVRAARRHAPQHVPQFAEPARRASAPQGRSRGCASPARSPAAKAMSRAPRSASSPAASPPPSGSAGSSRRRRRRRRSARSSTTSPAGISKRSTPARAPSSR